MQKREVKMAAITAAVNFYRAERMARQVTVGEKGEEAEGEEEILVFEGAWIPGLLNEKAKLGGDT